ncbi:hypothetical protein E4T39_01457 [Aureobasidium subglaciale]|nr:hypothetical protein E4T39_01457 [Aureobasidium subglaciale]
MARVQKRLKNVERVRKHKQILGRPDIQPGYHSSLYQLSEDCMKPTIIPPHILWCSDDGEAEQWLRHETVPWWSLAAFIDFCGHIIGGNLSKKGKSGRPGSQGRRLLACSRRYPLKDGKLIGQFEYFYKAWAQNKDMRLGLLLIEHDPEPEITISCAAQKLYRMIFNAGEREAHLLRSLDSNPSFTLPAAPVGLGITLPAMEKLVLPFHSSLYSTVPANSSSSNTALQAKEDVEMEDVSPTHMFPQTLIVAIRPSSSNSTNAVLRQVSIQSVEASGTRKGEEEEEDEVKLW